MAQDFLTAELTVWDIFGFMLALDHGPNPGPRRRRRNGRATRGCSTRGPGAPSQSPAGHLEATGLGLRELSQ
jgi:hypothetical protein